MRVFEDRLPQLAPPAQAAAVRPAEAIASGGSELLWARCQVLAERGATPATRLPHEVGR